MKTAAVFLISLLAVAVFAPAAGATAPGRNGVIAYGYFDGGDASVQSVSRLETATPAGKRGTPLVLCTVAPCGLDSDSRPGWSADGRRVAYSTGPSIVIRDVRAKTSVELPRLGAAVADPAFSPSGARLVVSVAQTAEFNAPRDLYVVRPSNGRVRLLARGIGSADWGSRDRIAFSQGGAVFVVRPDGSGLRRVARGGETPSWAPSGRTVVFTASRSERAVTVRSDGRHRRTLTRGTCHTPTLSPDGKLLLCDDSESLLLSRLSPRHRIAELNNRYSGDTETFGFGPPAWQARPR